MFDEYDEGTAKAAIDKSMIPEKQYFLSLSEDILIFQYLLNSQLS